MLRPLHDRVLIKPAASPNETASGLVLPEDRGETYVEMQGTVVAVGTCAHPLKADAEALAQKLDARQLMDAKTLLADSAAMLRDLVRREPCVQIGDDVIFSWAAGQQVTIDDEVYLMMPESDILAVIESEPV